MAGVPLAAIGPARGLQLADDEEEEFFVVNKFAGASNTNPDDFDDVLATRRYLGNHVQIYVDNRASASMTDAQIQAVGNRFDSQTYDTDVNAFGAPSDIDQNGKITVLLSPTVNALTTPEIAAQGARITGFFFGIDLFPRSVFPFGNQREIFYAVVVNENQQFEGARVTSAEVVDLLGSVFAHEFEHMISVNQHVLLRNGGLEDIWLDEGLAHAAESLNGYTNQNRLRSAFFLESPSEVGLVSNDDDLDARGAWWLFVQYLSERFGAPVLGRLVQTRSIGTANVAAATSQSFNSVFHDWVSMLVLDGEQVPGNNSIFELPSLDLRNEFELAKGQLGGRITGSYLDRRTVTPGGSGAAVFQEASSALYITVTSSDEGNELITVDGAASAGLQVSIIRTR